MKNILGSPARKNDFFYRENEISNILHALEKGENMQIAAPRRVGKTSILYYFIDNPKPFENFKFISIDVESCTSVNAYYKKILEELLKCDILKTNNNLFQNIFKRIKSVNIAGIGGFELNHSEENNYYNDVKILLENIRLDKQILVFLIDEFTIALDNIHEMQGIEETKRFLHTNRELRMNHHINENVKFILTGSIGLNSLVERLGLPTTINDLSVVSVNPLSKKKGVKFAQQILDSEHLKYTDKNIDYLLEKIHWLIPYFIKLIIDECRQIALEEETDKITNAMIDKSFKQAIDFKYNNFYNHYLTRLKSSFKNNELKFLIAILTETAKNESISDNRTQDLAVRYEVEDIRKNLLRTLTFDGYLTHNKSDNTYYFVSPLLKMWWYENV
ncbi:MAG: hypothetical protein KGV44_04165 [Flavobacteriaceae bacterium]|nr:hypothetical protein [Flavobacteriaceae bacterium]